MHVCSGGVCVVVCVSVCVWCVCLFCVCVCVCSVCVFDVCLMVCLLAGETYSCANEVAKLE